MSKKNYFTWKIIIISLCTLVTNVHFTLTTLAADFPFAGNGKIYSNGLHGIALTFNVNWGNEIILDILNVLEKEKKIPVTFFVSGSWAQKNPKIIKKIAAANYEIGTLGYDYKDLDSLSEKEIYNSYNKSLQVHKKLGLPRTLFARVPTGTYNKHTLNVFSQLELTAVHWSLNTNDWKSPRANSIISAIDDYTPGDIVLLHGSDSARQTAPALQVIITNLKKKDIPILSISEIISNGKTKTKIMNNRY